MVSVKTQEARFRASHWKRIPGNLPVFPLALTLLIAISSLLAAVWKEPESLISSERSWTWWTLKTLSRIKHKPDTVLLGSSLMVVAMAESDATAFNRRCDLAMYRGARYFDVIRESDDSRKRSINLAAPGQIPSDALLTMKAAWKAGIEPRSVIYGVAPRDFIDGTLTSPLNTEAFRCLKNLVACHDVRELVSTNPIERIRESLLDLFELRKRSHELSAVADKFIATSLGKSAGTANQLGEHPFDFRWRMKMLPSYKPLDMMPGVLFAEPMRLENVLYKDNLEDYRVRYRSPKMSFYTGQFRCLEKLSQLLERKGTRLVLVNMPLTSTNYELLPPGLYDKYLRDLKAAGRRPGCTFIDLSQFDAYYSKADFRDSVHMNGYGGIKFVNQLVCSLHEIIQADTSASHTLRIHGSGEPKGPHEQVYSPTKSSLTN